MGMDGSAGSPDARIVWRATANARMWAASSRTMAMSRAHRQGWAAKAASEDAMARAARVASRASDPGTGPADGAEAMERAIKVFRRAASAMDRASRAFRVSSRRARAASAEHRRAAAAFRHAADGAYEQLATRLAAGLRRNALGSSRLSRKMRTGADMLGRQADRWDAGDAWREEGEGGGMRRSYADAMEPILAGMLREAERQCAESTETARQAADYERSTADMQRGAAAEAERSAAAAAEAAARARDDPGAQEAAAAWRDAMAAARKAAAGGKKGGRAPADGAVPGPAQGME